MQHANVGTLTYFLLAARNGDSVALQRLIEHYQPALERRVVRQLGRRGTELESPQELALGVFAALHEELTTNKTWAMTVLNRQSLRSMLFTVLVCKMIDAARYSGAARRRGTVQESALDLPDGATFADLARSNDAGPADVALAEETLCEMRAAVAARFPDGVRVMEYLLQGCTPAQIARTLNWSDSKVRRAVDRLECLLQPWADDVGRSTLAHCGNEEVLS